MKEQIDKSIDMLLLKHPEIMEKYISHLVDIVREHKSFIETRRENNNWWGKIPIERYLNEEKFYYD